MAAAGELRTPWFAFSWMEYGGWWNVCGYVRGIALWWKPNRNPREGECLFDKELVLFTEVIGHYQQLVSLGQR